MESSTKSEREKPKSYIGTAACGVFDAFSPNADAETNNLVASTTGEFVKTAALFLKGRLAIPLTLAAYALDSAKPTDDWKDQLLDGGLGMAKGATMRGAFELAGPINNIAGKGLVLGITSRAAEIGFDRNFFNDKNGNSSFAAGVSKLQDGVFNPRALAMDVVTFGAAHGLTQGADALLAGRLSRSPLMSTIATGATFGLTTGSLEELTRQGQSGQPFDAAALAKHALFKAGVDGLAAIPGGLQANHAASVERVERARASDRIQDLVDNHRGGIRESMTFAFNNKPLVGNEFTKVTEQLGQPESQNMAIRRTKDGAPTSFESEHQFLKEGVEWRDTPVRVYHYGETQIIVPEAYAKTMEPVRAQRAAGDDSNASNHALPEDVVRSLEALPDKNLVRRVFLFDHANPEDAWHQKQLGDPNFRSGGSSTPDGDLSFYKRGVDLYLNADIFHEWSHIVKDRSLGASAMFDHAADLEADGYMQRPYAATQAKENWAVHLGEDFMHPDADVFFNLVKEAPIRSAVLARALAPTLQHSQSPFAPQLRERVRYVEENVEPKVRTQLLDLANKGGWESDSSIKLLLQIGRPEDVAKINESYISLREQPVGNDVVAKIANIAKATDIDLHGTFVARDGLEPLRNLPLETLDVSNTGVSDASMPAVGAMKSLSRLDLSNTHVGDGGVIFLKGLSNLRYLDLTGTSVSRYSIDYLQKANPELEIKSDYQ